MHVHIQACITSVSNASQLKEKDSFQTGWHARTHFPSKIFTILLLLLSELWKMKPPPSAQNLFCRQVTFSPLFLHISGNLPLHKCNNLTEKFKGENSEKYVKDWGRKAVWERKIHSKIKWKPRANPLWFPYFMTTAKSWQRKISETSTFSVIFFWDKTPESLL